MHTGGYWSVTLSLFWYSTVYLLNVKQNGWLVGGWLAFNSTFSTTTLYTLAAGSLSDQVQIKSDNAYDAYQPVHVYIKDAVTPPTMQYREHGPNLVREHSVWPDHPHGTLCPSLWEGLTVLRFLNAVWKCTFLMSTTALLCSNFSLFYLLL